MVLLPYSFASVAMLTHSTQQLGGGRVYLAYTSKSQSMGEEVRTETKSRTSKNAAYWLAQFPPSLPFFFVTRSHYKALADLKLKDLLLPLSPKCESRLAFPESTVFSLTMVYLFVK